MRISKELRDNHYLLKKLMNLAEQDVSKIPIVTNSDKPKAYAYGVLQGIDVMFYLLQEMGMSDAAIHDLSRRVKGYFEAF